MRKAVTAVLLFVCGVAAAKEAPGIPTSAIPQAKIMSQFYVYKDAGSRDNHYCPAGWMGSPKSMKFTPNNTVAPKSGTSCIRIDYDVAKDSETLWAGIYWAHPCSNWGNSKGGYNLSGFKKLTFWAKGTGYIDKFGFGGIQGQAEEGDSGEGYVEGIDLTSDWKQYTIDLKGVDLHHIIGGFVFAANADSNYKLKNVVIYLDDIVFTK